MLDSLLSHPTTESTLFKHPFKHPFPNLGVEVEIPVVEGKSELVVSTLEDGTPLGAHGEGLHRLRGDDLREHLGRGDAEKGEGRRGEKRHERRDTRHETRDTREDRREKREERRACMGARWCVDEEYGELQGE